MVDSVRGTPVGAADDLGIDREVGVNAVLKNFLADLIGTHGLRCRASIRDLDRTIFAGAG